MDNSKQVYWCGDHACINKKEKKAYFEKNMIVEKRILNKENKLSKSEKDEILKKIREQEKEKYKNKKETKKLAHARKKEASQDEEKLIKRKSIDKKTSIQDENDCSDPRGFHQKMMCAARDKIGKKEPKKTLSGKDHKELLDKDILNTDSSEDFNDYVEKITKRNKSRSYPDINIIEE